MSVQPLPLRFRVSLRRTPGTLGSAWTQPLAIAGMVLGGAWILIAIFVPLIAPYDPLAQTSQLFLEPSTAHLFGTDELGRDIFSRVLWGSRLSLPLAFFPGHGRGGRRWWAPGGSSAWPFSEGWSTSWSCVRPIRVRAPDDHLAMSRLCGPRPARNAVPRGASRRLLAVSRPQVVRGLLACHVSAMRAERFQPRLLCLPSWCLLGLRSWLEQNRSPVGAGARHYSSTGQRREHEAKKAVPFSSAHAQPPTLGGLMH